MIKILIRLLFALFLINSSLVRVNAQLAGSISLDSCLVWAERNYPEIVQYQLYRQSGEYNLENTSKGKLPQIGIYGQASYQSDVTSLPDAQGLNVEEISKDQYNVYGEIVQPLTDIAVVNQRKRIQKIQNEIDQANVEVSLYQIKERVSDMYFGILLVRGQLEQTTLSKSDINAGINSVRAAVNYGTALKSTLHVLEAELLGLEQREIEQQAILVSYIQMLGRFTGKELTVNTRLETPQIRTYGDEILRPELRLYNARINALSLQSDLIQKNNLPKFSLFLQTGIGRPALNLLSNDFEFYYLGGLKLSWNLSNFYTSGNEKNLYSIEQDIVNSQRETFLFNTRLTMTSQSAEIQKTQELIAKDEQIVTLREQVLETSKMQLDNGVITSNDYTSVVIDADLARQSLIVHQIELLQLQNQYKLTTGN